MLMNTTAPVAHLEPNWNLIRDGVTPRMQYRCNQVASTLQAILPDADICTRHRFGGISKVYATFAGRTAAIELQSTGGDILYRALDGFGKPLSAVECPIDRLSFGGPVEEAVNWLQRA